MVEFNIVFYLYQVSYLWSWRVQSYWSQWKSKIQTTLCFYSDLPLVQWRKYINALYLCIHIHLSVVLGIRIGPLLILTGHKVIIGHNAEKYLQYMPIDMWKCPLFNQPTNHNRFCTTETLLKRMLSPCNQSFNCVTFDLIFEELIEEQNLLIVKSHNWWNEGQTNGRLNL